MSDSPATRRQPPADPYLRPIRQYPAERYYRDGSVMAWPLHLAVLQGLLDRPGGVAPSRNDCVRAAMPYARLYRKPEPTWHTVCYAVPRVVERGWVARRREGRQVRFTLTPRGRQILDGTAVPRLQGGLLYVPGWRAGTAREDDTVVCLGRGTRLTVPAGWTADDPRVAEALALGGGAVNGCRHDLGPHGIMLSLRPRASATNGASFTMMLLSCDGMDQEGCARLTDGAIAIADRKYFRPEAESGLGAGGWEISAWEGTTRTTVGSRFGLVTRFAVRHRDGRELRKETHAVYLGTRQLVIHVFLPAAAGTAVEDEVRRMLESVRVKAGA